MKTYNFELLFRVVSDFICEGHAQINQAEGMEIKRNDSNWLLLRFTRQARIDYEAINEAVTSIKSQLPVMLVSVSKE